MDLGALKKVALSDELDSSHLNRIAQRFREFETTFSSMSQKMRDIRPYFCKCCPKKPKKFANVQELRSMTMCTFHLKHN